MTVQGRYLGHFSALQSQAFSSHLDSVGHSANLKESTYEAKQ